MSRFAMKFLSAAILYLAIGFLSAPGAFALDDIDKSLKQFKILIEILDKIQQEYVDPNETETEKLLNGAIHGLVSSLDRYSVYMDKDEAREFNEQTQGEYSGLGIQIDMVDGWLTVIEPFPNTPAAKAGIIGGDRIVEINGESTKGIQIYQAQKRLKGETGERVALTIARPGEQELIPVSLVRAIIETYAIAPDEKKLLDRNVGYIRLRDFTQDAAAELEKAIRDLQNQGMKSLILDLRDNVGGLLDVSIEICDLFIDKQNVIVSHRDQKGRVKTFHADRAPLGNFPMVVLVNEFSASASEIVAGCIQDHRRGLLVGPAGHKTFGKGSVQSMIELNALDGAYLKLTIAKYFTPSGRSIDDEKGLTPDVYAPVTDEMRAQIRREGKAGFIPKQFLQTPDSQADEEKQSASVSEVFEAKKENGPAGLVYDIELYTAYQSLITTENLRFGNQGHYSLGKNPKPANPRN